MITFEAHAPSEVHQAALAACNIPNKHLGRDREGVDCAGCVQILYNHFNIDCKLPLNYALRWWASNPGRMVAHLDMLGWKKVLSGRAEPLDFLIFAIVSRQGDHGGVFTGQSRFVHCWDERSQESLLTDEGPFRRRWVDRIVGVYRPQ